MKNPASLVQFQPDTLRAVEDDYIGKHNSLLNYQLLVRIQSPPYRGGVVKSHHHFRFCPLSEFSSVWLERMFWEHEVGGSNPPIPTLVVILREGGIGNLISLIS